MRESIKEFCILSVEMEGFKKFKEAYSVELGRIAYISGGNGQGKTTVADAIAYAFCGTPYWGEKSCDRLRNPECDEMRVTVKFVDENGECHTLIRRKNKDITTITLDSMQLRQVDLIGMFVEKDIFLSILNPLFFIEKIATDGREFLQKLIPAAEHGKVLLALSENSRTLLANEKFFEPSVFIKQKRDELKGFENDFNYYTGQLDTLKSQHQNGINKIDEIIRKGESIAEEKEALEKKQFEGLDIEALRGRQSQISASLSCNSRDELLKQQAEIQNRQYTSKYTEEIAKLKTEIQSISQKGNKVIAQAKGIKVGDKCPTCFTVVTEANHQEIIAGLKKQYDELMKQYTGAMEAYKELTELDEKSKNNFEQFRADDLKKIEAKLCSCEQGNVSEIAMLEDKIKYGNLSREEYAKLQELKSQADACAKEIEVLSGAEELPNRIEAVQKELTNINAKKADVQKLISAANEYASKRAELTLMQLKMNRAAIKLHDVVKTTGEIKDDFKFTYDGKDYRWLSASEKLKAGLEVTNLLRTLTGLKYPTFIDNAECITTKLSPIGGQVIVACATGTEFAVQVSNPNSNTQRMKEAA